jgi:radical SAM superfamily enzyme YgiQ (UPF0313 family)
MKTLLISPPFVPVYFNSDYNFVEIGEVAAHIAAQPDVDLTVRDYSALNGTWQHVLDDLAEEWNVVVIHNTIENFEAVERLATLVRLLQPHAVVGTYGRLSRHMTAALDRLGIDVIVIEQDWEVPLGILASRGRAALRPELPGSRVKIGDSYVDGAASVHLSDWSLPLDSALPVRAYGAMGGKGNESVVAGDLGIGMSRGCDSRCEYCPIPVVNGGQERFRPDVDRAADYIYTRAAAWGLRSASLFAANFTLNDSYVRRFSMAMRARGARIGWKCVTSPLLLSRDLIDAMAASKCLRIAIGVESLKATGEAHYRGRADASQIATVGEWCRQSDVRVVGFVMVGIPGQTREDVRFTLRVLSDSGITPRPMVYTNFRRMAAHENLRDTFWYARKASMAAPGEWTVSEVTRVVRSWREWLAETA